MKYIFLFIFFILFIYLFIFIIIFRYAIAYLRTGSYAPAFRPPSSVHVLGVVPISVYIQKFSPYFFHMVFTMCFGTVYNFYFRMRSCRNTLEIILSLIWYVLVCAINPRSSVCSLQCAFQS